MNFQILRGFCLGGGIDVFPGETRNDIPEYMRQRLIQSGKIKAASTGNPLVEKIATAPDIETLEQILAEDPAVVAAYEQRVEELETGVLDAPKKRKNGK